MKVKRGDIVYLKATFPMRKHIQGGNRPFVVVSNDIGNLHSDVCLIVPLTGSKRKHPLPTHTLISFNGSTCLCEQIFTVSQSDIDSIKYHLPFQDVEKIDRALKRSLDLG